MKTGGHLYPSPWARAWEQIDADFEAHLGEIRRFLRRLSVLAQVTDRVAIMYAGCIVEEDSASALLTEPRHPYSRALVGAFPVVGEMRGYTPPRSRCGTSRSASRPGA